MSSPIPEDHISSLSGSPPPPSPTPKLAIRQRAHTFSSPPRPETDPQQYSKERIQRGIDYAEARLQSKSRKPSPTTQKALTEYVLVCKDLLEEKSPEQLVDLYKMEQDLCEKRFLQSLKENTDQEITTSLQELRRYQFFARYGDYLEQACRKLKITATKYETPQWDKLAGGQKWTTISKNLRKEEPEWSKNNNRNKEEVQTTIAVEAACNHLGIDFDQAVTTIHLYAERNEKFHNTFNLHIEDAKFSDVAHTLYSDLVEIERVCNLEDAKEQVLLEVLINELSNHWFQKFVAHEPSSWIPKKALLDEAAKKDPEQRNARAAENKEQAEANVAAKIQKMAEDDHIIATLMGLEPVQIAPKEFVPLARGKEKKRQSKEVEEPFTPRTKRKRWEEIVKMGDLVEKAKGLAQMHETEARKAERQRALQLHRVSSIGREWAFLSNRYRQGTRGSEPPSSELSNGNGE